MARIPLLLSCPEHGCLLKPVLGHPAQYLFWADPVAEPRPAGDDIVAMDRYTQEGLSIGTVHLPRRPVHFGVWFRLLRTLLDEVSSATTRLGPRAVADLRLIWQETGRPFRGGLNKWKPYEVLDWPLQQALLHAAAVALCLALDGRIQVRGTLGHLLTIQPDLPAGNGDPPRVDPWAQTMADLQAAIEAAQRNPGVAGHLFAFFTMSSDSRTTYNRARRILLDIGVPSAFIPPFRKQVPAGS